MSWGTTKLEHHKAAQAYPLSSPLCLISFPWCSQLMNSRKLQFICKLIAFTFLNWQKKLTLILPGLKQSVNHLYDVTETETPNAFIAISGNMRDEATEAGGKWQESSQSRGVLATDLHHRSDPQPRGQQGMLSQGSDSPTPLLLLSKKNAFQGLALEKLLTGRTSAWANCLLVVQDINQKVAGKQTR